MLALLPPDLHLYVALFTGMALAITAAIDARTGLVPPLPLAVAAVLVIANLAIGDSERAFTAPLQAGLFYIVIWALNEAYYHFMGRDALGMGDAHWSLVAALAYGWQPVLMAWGVGAWLALAFMGTRKLLRKPATHVYFVPFLFLGLMGVLTLYWKT